MKYCCEKMKNEIQKKCDEHTDVFECPERLVFYSNKFREYGIILHNGGNAFDLINYCPWCGQQLPNSLRDEWFNELEKLGLEPTDEKKISEGLKSDPWWMEKGL